MEYSILDAGYFFVRECLVVFKVEKSKTKELDPVDRLKEMIKKIGIKASR